MQEAEKEKMVKQAAKRKCAKKGGRKAVRHGKRTQSTARTKASKPKATDHGDTDEEEDRTDDKDTEHCFSCGVTLVGGGSTISVLGLIVYLKKVKSGSALSAAPNDPSFANRLVNITFFELSRVIRHCFYPLFVIGFRN